MWMLPWDTLIELANHYGVGAKKYPARNWEQGMKWNEGVASSLMRHLAAWANGEDIDPENGQHHDVAILWNAVALVTYRLRGVGIDDRPSLSKGNDVPRHTVERDISDPVVPVATTYDPTSAVMPDYVPDVVWPDDHSSNPWGRLYTTASPVTSDIK